MKINTVLLSLLCFLISFGAAEAQDVLLKKKQSISGFISIEPLIANYKGGLSFNQSANAAVLMNNRFYIGGFSEVLLSSKNNNLFDDIDCYEPDFGSAGLFIGSVIMPEKLVHFDLRAKMGIGALRLSETDTQSIFEDDYEPVFVFHPSAGIEINITKFFKLNTHVGYRYIGDVNDPNFTSQDLSGLTGQIGLVFGWFGQKKKQEREVDEELMSL